MGYILFLYLIDRQRGVDCFLYKSFNIIKKKEYSNKKIIFLFIFILF